MSTCHIDRPPCYLFNYNTKVSYDIYPNRGGFNKSKFDLDEFWMGVNTELEHGKISIQTNVTGDDPIITGKIALAHLNEFPDYYKRLKVLEEEAKAYWNK
ncbi:DUF5661 family protein [Heyndrickxia sporothermodurans]|uniref:DUF5661 family protein n=1 Tax=Heyndrickxia sporothermodurans TaxID=46224 RepID=UPI0035E256EC